MVFRGKNSRGFLSSSSSPSLCTVQFDCPLGYERDVSLQSSIITASGDVSTNVRYLSSLCRNASSACFRSVMSRHSETICLPWLCLDDAGIDLNGSNLAIGPI